MGVGSSPQEVALQNMWISGKPTLSMKIERALGMNKDLSQKVSYSKSKVLEKREIFFEVKVQVYVI